MPTYQHFGVKRIPKEVSPTPDLNGMESVPLENLLTLSANQFLKDDHHEEYFTQLEHHN